MNERPPADSLFMHEISIPKYTEVFELLRDQYSLNPKRCLMCGCGYGADLIAAYRVWSQANYVGVSVGQTPSHSVIHEMGEQLHFVNEMLLTYLRSLTKPEFDLATLFNIVSYDLDKIETYEFLRNTINPQGFLFFYEGGGGTLNISGINQNFRRIELPKTMIMRGHFSLWTPK